MYKLLKLAATGFCLVLATGQSLAIAKEDQRLTLGAPILPHSSSIEIFDLPVPVDGQLLGDVLNPIDVTEELSRYVGATVAPGAPTLDDYFLQAEIRDISMSPDGKRLAVIKRAGHSHNVYIIDLEQNRTVVYALGEPKNQYFTGVKWLTNDRIGIEMRSASIVIVSSGREMVFFVIYNNRMIAVGDDGTNPVLMMGTDEKLQNNRDLSTVISFIEADPDHIMMLAHEGGVNLYKVNIHTGASEVVDKGKEQTVSYIVDPAGNPLFRMDQPRGSKTVKVYQYDAEQDKWIYALKLDLDDPDEDFSKQLTALSGKESLLLIDRKDGDEFASLHRYNIKEDRYEEVVYSVDGYDLFATLSTGTSGDVAGISYIDDRPRTVFFDDNYQQIQSHLEKVFPNGAVNINRISTDDRRLLFSTDEPWQPGTYYVYDDKEKQAHPIVALAPQLNRSRTTSVDTLSWKSKDGMEIRGYLTYPTGRQADALPLIVFPHGGPFARDWLTFNRIAQYWASRGYAVFQPNFRGSTGFGRTYQEAGYREYGGAMIDDISSGVETLIKSRRVDPDRICAAGISYGGYASLMLPIKSDLFACAVSINGVSDLILQSAFDIKNTKGRQAKEAGREWFRKVMGDTRKEKKELDRQSPLLRYKEITTPLLLIAAKDDTTVDPSNSRKLFKVMQKATMDVEYIEYEEGGHSLAWGGNMRKMLARTDAFFYEHIGRTTTIAQSSQN